MTAAPLTEWTIMSTRTFPTRGATPVRDPLPGLRPAGPDSFRGLAVFGLVAAGWCAGVGLAVAAVLVLLGWAFDSASTASVGDALRVAGLGWLLAHHAPVDIPGGSLTVAPLGLTLVSGTLLVRAGRVAGAHRAAVTRTAGALVTAAVALPYAALAGVVAALSDVGGTRVQAPAAVAAAGALAAAAVAAGFLLGRYGAADALGSSRWRATAAGGAAGVLTLLGTGAVLAGAALGWHQPRVAQMTGALDPGTGGGTALLVLSVLLVPNAAVWAASYVTGAGFAVGTGTAVGPFLVQLGPVPALPLLAALPAGGATGPLVALPALLGPVLGGVLAGRLVQRRLPELAPARAALWGLAAGAGGGLALGVLAALAGGAAGPGRLAAVGPAPLAAAGTAALELGVVAAATAWQRARVAAAARY